MPQQPVPFFRPSLSALLLVLFLIHISGCTAWRQLEQPTPVALAGHKGRMARVILVDGWEIVADSVRVSDSALVLLPNWSVSKTGRGPVPMVTDSLGRGAVLLSQVVGAEVREPKPGRTVGLVLGLVVVVPVVIILLNRAASSEGSYICPESP